MNQHSDVGADLLSVAVLPLPCSSGRQPGKMNSSDGQVVLLLGSLNHSSQSVARTSREQIKREHRSKVTNKEPTVIGSINSVKSSWNCHRSCCYTLQTTALASPMDQRPTRFIINNWCKWQMFKFWSHNENRSVDNSHAETPIWPMHWRTTYIYCYTLYWPCNVKSPTLPWITLIANIIPSSRDPFAFDVDNIQRKQAGGKRAVYCLVGHKTTSFT